MQHQSIINQSAAQIETSEIEHIFDLVSHESVLHIDFIALVYMTKKKLYTHKMFMMVNHLTFS